jgi:tryptophanyl-tRNA synthetase
MNYDQKTMLSGIQPTGAPHIGNYFGMMKQLVDFQDQYTVYGMIVNYHAFTTIHDRKTLSDNTFNVALDFLGIGVDPEKVILFKQSDVPEHTELCWVLNCLVTVPWLSRAHAFKDKVDKGIEASVGLFDYPVLMAADMLLYDAEIIPVGEDQKQHVEMARELARKFNAQFGETFPVEPQELIMKEVSVVPGLDGQKMSKSYNNIIPLFGTDEEIKKAVMGIVTDSSGEVPTNVYAIHKLFKSASELESLYTEKKGKYKDLKEVLLADILTFITPMRERRKQYADNPQLVADILKNGAEKARVKAVEKMKLVRDRIGLG